MSDDTDLREEVTGSRWGFEGKLVRVRVDEVRLPNGRETVREVVDHPGAVAIVPLHSDGTITFVRQWRQAAEKVLLELPAGTLEAGEDPADCARREMAEEVGLECRDLRHLFSSFLAPGYSSELLHTFLATGLTEVPSQLEWDEALEPLRLPLAEAQRMVLEGELQDAKTICGILLAERYWRGD
ncbi:MAG: NUDIX domain-containing protein [Armatimonadia bacterium]|nr:NUDIX domain-containing protein [Armatimonadia bacterium]